MAPLRPSSSVLVALARCFLTLAAAPACALRSRHRNLLAYRGHVRRAPADFRTVMASMNPDVVIAQELNTSGRRTRLVNASTTRSRASGRGSGSRSATEGGAIFWKPSKVSVSNITSIATGGPRPVLVGLVKAGRLPRKNPVLVPAPPITVVEGGTDRTRRVECTSLRTTLNNVVTTVGQHLRQGPRTSTATGRRLPAVTESQADNDGRAARPQHARHGNQFAYRTVHHAVPLPDGLRPELRRRHGRPLR